MSSQGSGKDLLIVAGEASGDLHGARLLAELGKLAPQVRAFGLGGEELRAAGLEGIADSSEISVVGITEVLRVLPRAREIFDQLLIEVERRQARAAVLIDFPEFNLRLARQLKRRGVEVLYYISPQVWAWRQGRVRAISRWIDRMLVILPFEVTFYRGHGIDALNVGHPLVDEVPVLPQRWDREGGDHEPFVVALLPGSRHSEIEANLPVMLSACRRLADECPCAFRLIKARPVDEERIAEFLRRTKLPVEIISDDRFAAIAESHLAICASGTATLEVGLLGTPMVVVYRVSRGSYWLGRMLVRLPHIALVNLVLGKRAVPELIQNDATAKWISRQAAAILTDQDRIRSIREDLGGLRERLGESGASRRAAEVVLRQLGWDER